jgi:large subunit ribosomal protein L24
MAHVRKGDMVVVTKGKDRGKRGKVLRVLGARLIVEKVNMIKRHSKPTQKNPQGGIIDKEGSIAVANVLLWDDKLGRGTRTKNVIEKDGSKVRVGVKSGTKFPSTGL